MKRQYETPELMIVDLEQSDIITASGIMSGKDSVIGINKGEGQEHKFGWVD